MKEMDAMYDWVYEMKNTRNSYGKAGIKQIYQSDLDAGMKLYLELKKTVEGQTKAIKMYFDNANLIDKILEGQMNE